MNAEIVMVSLENTVEMLAPLLQVISNPPKSAGVKYNAVEISSKSAGVK